MKLHLPKLLRNSVLACITAVAGIATTTVGTATFTGGVVAFALSSQQALGEIATVTTAQNASSVKTDAVTRIVVDDGGVLTMDQTVTLTDGLVINSGGVVETSMNPVSNTTPITINAGGTLNLNAMDNLGWSDNDGQNNGTILLRGEAGNVAKLQVGDRQTTSKLISMSGYATIGETSAPGDDAMLDMWKGGGFSISGIENVIDADVKHRISFVAQMAADSALTWNGAMNGTSNVTFRAEDGGKAASLVLGDAESDNVQAGTLTVSGITSVNVGGSLNVASLRVDNSAMTLKAANNVATNVNIADDAIITLEGGLTLNGTLSITEGGTLVNNGTLVYGENFRLDLSNLTAVAGDGNVMKYTIMTGSGNKSLEALTATNIIGIITGGKEWTFGSDGTISYVMLTKEVVWSGGALTWNAEGTTFDNEITYVDYDKVNIAGTSEITIGAETGVHAFSVEVTGDGTVAKLMNSNPLVVSDGLFVRDGATLEITTKTGGSSGVVQGEVTVEDGGKLVFRQNDACGWDATNATRVLNVLAGGVLELAHNSNETFGGTLNLDGTVKGTGSSSATWDMFNGNSTINVSAGAVARMENLSLRLRRDNAVVSVGDGGSLTIDNGVSKGDRGNGKLIKEGGGALIINGSSSLDGVTVNGGSVKMGSNTDWTAESAFVLAGVAGSTYEKTGSGNLIVDMSGYAGSVIVSSGSVVLSAAAENTNERSIAIGENATLDLNGKPLYYSIDLSEGATLKNGGDAVNTNKRQLHTITLSGDATIEAASEFGMVGNSHATTHLYLNNKTLTKDGDDVFHLHNTIVETAGILQVNAGTLKVHGNGSGTQDLTKASVSIGDSATFELGKENESIVDLTVADGGTLTIGSGLTLTTTGSVKLGQSVLTGNLCVGSTIQQIGTVLDLNDLTLSVSGFGGLTSSEVSDKTTTGLKSLNYYVVEGTNITNAQSSVSVGGVDYTLVKDNQGLSIALDSVYYIASSDTVAVGGSLTSADAARAAAFCIDGTLQLKGNIDDTRTAGFILTGATGVGTIEVDSELVITESALTSSFNGNIKVGATGALKFGDIGEGINLRDGRTVSLNAGIVIDGGQLFYHGKTFTIPSLTSTNDASVFRVLDSAMTGRMIHVGEMNLQENLAIVTRPAGSEDGWKYTMNVDVLKGEGDLTTNAHEASDLTLNDTSAYDGTVRLGNNVTLKLGTGDDSVKVHIGDNNAVAASAGWSGKVCLSGGKNDYNFAGKYTAQNSSSSVAFCGFETWISNSTVAWGVELINNGDSAALVLNNGSSGIDTVAGFAGSISGSGDMKYIWATGTTNFKTTHEFSGDTSGWDGWFISGASAGKAVEARFTAGGNVFATAGNGGVKDERTSDYHLSVSIDAGDTATVFNGSIINAASVAVNSDTTFKKSVNTTSMTLGAGTDVTLGANSSLTVTNGLSVAAGQSLRTEGAATLSSALTFSGGALHLGGVLNLGTHELSVDTANKTALTLADGMVAVGAKSVTLLTGVSNVAGITLTRETKLSDLFSVADSALADYYVSYDADEDVLSLVTTFAETRTWSVDNAHNGGVWETTKQFGATADDTFAEGDYAVFGALSGTDATESVTIKGSVVAGTVTVNAGAGNAYEFAADASGGTLTTTGLAINSGTAKFGLGTLDITSLGQITVDGVLDLSSLSAVERNGSALITKLAEVATGNGTVILPAAQYTELGVESLRFNVNIEAGDMLKIDRAGNDKLAFNVGKSLVLKHVNLSRWGQGKLELGAGVNMIVENGGSVDVNAEINLGCSNSGDKAATITIQQGGKVRANHITSNGGGDWRKEIFVEGGVLELTGTAGIASGIDTTVSGGTLKADTNDWTITGGIIGGATAGSVKIEGSKTITLSGGSLKSTINNADGKLAFAGEVNLVADGFNTRKVVDDYSEGTNGFATTDTYYQLATATDAEHLTVNTGATFKVGEVLGTYEDSGANLGWVRLDGTDYGTAFYVNSGTVTYGTDGFTDGVTTGITKDGMTALLSGGTLQLTTGTVGDAFITADSEGGILELNGQTLSQASIGTLSGAVSLKGGNTSVYTLVSGTDALATNLTLANDWSGTVQVSNVGDVNYNLTNTFASLSGAVVSGVYQGVVEATGMKGYFNWVDKGYNLKLTNAADGTAAVTILYGRAKQGQDQEFVQWSGKISGTGDMAFASWEGTDANHQCNYEFMADVSGWSGKFINAGQYANNVNIIFSGAATTINASVVNAGNVEDCKSILTIGGTEDVKYTMNGAVSVDKLVVNQEAEFTSAEIVAVADTLAVNDAMTLTNAAMTVGGELSGTGSITGTALSLQGATNTIGDLKLTGALTLGTAEAVSRLTAGDLNVGTVTLLNVDSAVKEQAYDSIIDAASLSKSMVITMSDDLLKKKLGEAAEKTITLLTLETALADGTTVTLAGLTEGAEAADSQISVDGTTKYTLGWNEEKKVLGLTASLLGSGWKGLDVVDEADNVDLALWSEASSWSEDAVPTEETIVKLDGSAGGQQTIWLEGTANKAKILTVDHLSGYTLNGVDSDGNALSIKGKLVLNRGVLNLRDVDVEVNGDLELNSEAASVQNWNGNQLSIGGDLTSSGTIYNAGGAELEVTGALTNSGDITNDGSIEVKDGVTNNGDIYLQKGTATLTGAVDNDGSIAVSGGVVTINGAVDNDGTITIGGTDKDTLATVKVNGNLDNTNGTITIGSAAVADNPDTEDDETAAATYGSLTVTGDLTGTGATDKLTVEEGSSLAVGGDLTAADVALKFGGDVTVGGTATVGDLTIAENASFAAANATIGAVDNDGTLTVGTVDATTGELVGGTLSIDSLSGSGDVTVGKDGTLNIGAMTEFSGQLLGEGKLSTGTEGFVLETLQNTVKDTATATDIAADSLTVSGRWMKDGEVVGADTEGAVWDSANGSILGDVATNSIVIDVLNAAVSPHLKLNSLTGKLDDADTDTTVEITLTELGSSEGVQDLIAAGEKTYKLLHIAGSTTDLKLNDNLSDADEQLLWKSGLKLSDLQSTSPMALRAAGKDVSISVLEQTLKEATWDTAGDTTKIGLDLGTLTNGTMVLHSNDMLDNVKSVNVTADTELDLSGSNDTAAVNIQGLTGEKNLTIVGNGDTVNSDTVNITTAVKQDDDTTLAGKYDGALALERVKASVSGQYGSSDSALGSGTLEKKGVLVGEDATAKLDVKDSLVVLDGGSLSGDSKMDGGALAVKSTNAAIVEGNIMVDTGDKLTIKNGTLIAIVGEATDSLVLDVQGTGKHVIADLGTVDGAAGDVAIVDAQNKSIAVMDKYFSGVRLENGKVVADRNTSYYSDKADESLSANGAAGMQLADAAMVALNPQATAPQGDLAGVLNMLDTATGAAADELGASLAGASTAVLGMATMGDVDRQLQAIRNRTTTMGVDQSVANEDMPYFNAWINAEGDRSELSESGTEGGYELSSWGGTVGFDVDLCPTFTAGMALTAMYGDIDTTGADKASGNIDTYYVTAFARYAPSAWTHTFVATVGMSDISLDRHVAGAEMEGETDGLSFGLMYEVGRVFALDEDGSTCLQPVFNVTWKHTAIDAYTEDGSDLALEVDEQTLDTVTFGLGARLQTVVGESMYNRTSILEARVLAKADVGDRSGSSDVALSALPGAKASVDSAEMGAFGLEAGAGLTIPVGDEGGSIFMDASVELRSDYTNVNGTVGYRINF